MAQTFAWRRETPEYLAAFTDRAVGNLALHVKDDPAVVGANRATLADSLHAREVLFLHQVHSNAVVVADEPWDQPPAADAAVTTRPGLFLAVMVADCVPVVLVSDGVVGIAHAGRVGMAENVAGATVEAMRAAGADQIIAFLGPSICARCYEVPAMMRDECGSAAPYSASVSRRATPSLDLAAGVAEQLRDAGAGVEILSRCTAEDERLFSYRRDGLTGRFVGVVGLR